MTIPATFIMILLQTPFMLAGFVAGFVWYGLRTGFRFYRNMIQRVLRSIERKRP